MLTSGPNLLSEALTKWSMSQEKSPDTDGIEIQETEGMLPCGVGLKKIHDYPLQISDFVTLRSDFVRLMDRVNVNW